MQADDFGSSALWQGKQVHRNIPKTPEIVKRFLIFFLDFLAFFIYFVESKNAYLGTCTQVLQQ
jgi:hypothetical protein